MENISRLLFTAIFLLAGLHIQAQSLTVTGKVVDSDGFEVIGANVTIKGTPGSGTITDLDGKYSLKVNNPSQDILVFTYIGMNSQEIAVKGRNQINVTLKTDAVMLDEVVAIGYGTSKRKDLTGSVVSVKSDELLKVPTSDITQALAGRVAGVQVSQSEGAPGASISIRVRGGISITQSNEPLYIIDGFPSEDGLSNLDPAEIETIDILKDASSTAIYGARGANGVVVITTKSGAKNEQKMSITFDSYVGFKNISNKLSTLSTKEFALLDYERRISAGKDFDKDVQGFEKIYGKFSDLDINYGNRPGVDWQEETLGRTAITQNYRVGIAGGNKDLKYNLGYSYFKDQGAMLYSGNDKHNISFGINHNASDRLQVTARATFDQIKTYGMGTSENGDRFNKMQHILQYRPTVGMAGSDDMLLTGMDPLLEDESGNVMQNPLISAAEELNNKEFRTFQANAGLTFKLMKGLTFRNNTGMRYQTRRYDIFFGDQSMTAIRSNINGSIQNSEAGSFQTSNVLTYDFNKHKHHLTIMGGQEYVSYWTRFFKASSSNFPNDVIGLGDLSLGTTPGVPQSGVNYDDKLLSFFGRANYSFADKYIFTASLRADGSSKFGPNSKWGYFPAVSGAWRVCEEDFIQSLNLFSDLKLRVGYGMAGNNRIGSYGALDILGSVTYPIGDGTAPGYAPKQIPNPDLRWESNNTFNLGIDMGFFNQRLTVSPEFYINRSTHLLLDSRVPSSSGFSNMLRNIGETQNLGIDLIITSVNYDTKTFGWTTNLNFSHNKNTIKALSGEAFFLEEANFGYSQKTHKIEVGKPLGQFYGYQTLGVYEVDDFDYNPTTQTYLIKEGIATPSNIKREQVRPGMWKFANLSGDDTVIDENDKTVIGNATPLFYGGFNNNFRYKNFDLSVFFTFSYGGEVLNATKLTNTKAGRSNKNILDAANSSNRFMTINGDGQIITDPVELATINRGKTVAAYHDLEDGDKYIHSWGVEDASYLKLSNITLGYNFPKRFVKKASIQSLRLYATASNLFTLTKYTGLDPEVSTRGYGLTPGVDFGAYPRSRSFVFGINLAF
ncbi:TonB-dependent receptor [Bacteroides sp.]|uniref:SusC/RagA family TonB-linked outer membrane protein n=1 Tax=Bacteroides sp. TaxID=29523 RepID=UPI002FC5E865